MPGYLQQHLWFERSCSQHLKRPRVNDHASFTVVEYPVHLFYAMLLHRFRLEPYLFFIIQRSKPLFACNLFSAAVFMSW